MASTPDTPSTDHAAMSAYWTMVDTMLEGADAMRSAGVRYLPQFPQETDEDYDYRRKNAKFTNVYADIVSNLAAKPFAEKVAIEDKSASERIVQLAEDIDGRGNNLHVFASNCFFSGINSAIDWILVDYTKGLPGRTRAEEQASGARPYWIHIPAVSMLAVYTATVAGKEVFVHARIREDYTERDGYAEKTINRVRIFNREPTIDAQGKATGYGPATFEVWEKRAKVAGGAVDWLKVDDGAITLGVIPLVPFITGRRKAGSWRFVPPMRDAAFLQIEHYQQETALKAIKELTAFPMLAGNGVTPMIVDGKPAPVPVGPKSVLYAPAGGEKGSHGEWKFIEPTAESLKFLAADVASTEQQLRELGRQPLTAQTGNLTVVTTAFAAQKGNSAIQAWALNLKDALEQAFKLTAMWLKDSSQPVVKVFTDFALDMGDDKGPETLLKMREQGDLSQETLWAENKRRNILSADFDPDLERERLLAEMPGDDSDDEITGAT